MNQHEFELLMDERLQGRLGYPDELGLIEILNRYEYQMNLEEKSSLNSLADGGQERRLQVSILKDHLSRKQGGKLDRFGVRSLSFIELEHLQQEIERDIEQLARQAKPTPPAKSLEFLGAFFAGLPEIVFGGDPAQYQLFVKRKMLSEVQLQLQLKRAPPQQPTQESRPTPHQVRAQKLAEARDLEAERDRVQPTISDLNFRNAYVNSMNDKIQKLYDSL